MDIKRGIAVSPGIALGPALVFDTEGIVIPQRSIPASAVDSEISRLAQALDLVAQEAKEREQEIVQRLPADLAHDISSIFSGHALFAQDHMLRSEVENLIRTNLYSAEFAVSRAIFSLVRKLGDGNPQFARLAADLRDLEKQVLRVLTGVAPQEFSTSGETVIILAHDLTPSETALLDPETVHAFATESGGPTSHTAIMAGALELPAVVGIGRFLHTVSHGDFVIVDGTEGLLIINPDPETVIKYERLLLEQNHKKTSQSAEILAHAEPVTKDGERITLLGNIEFPNEAAHCLERGAEGVGLYRTEFLYINKTSDPTEEEHFEAYRSVLRAIGDGKPVVIRTLDLGADKFSSVSGLLSTEKNPFLGLRSVRLCLRNHQLFKTQLRAILRASVYGNVRIMFPMVSTVMELRQCRSMLKEVGEDLEEQGIPYKPDIPIGTMIEVPSAALVADLLAKEVDFFSIGTNDLVQYTLAADRNNENVAGLYNASDPAVLRLIKFVTDASIKAKITANVCGEMSGEALFAPLLLGLGIRNLSATPRKIPEIKRVIRAISIPEAERIALEALRMESAREVTSYLREQLRRILPEDAD